MFVLDLFKSKKRNLIGIDISASSVKLLELSRSGNRYCVEAFAVVTLPPETVADKMIRNSAAFAIAIKQALLESKTLARFAVIAIADSLAITKVIHMDKGMTDYEIETQIHLEAEKYIPYPLEEVSFDFSVLGDSSAQEDQVDVLLVACRSTAVSNGVDALAEADITVDVVDVESYAIERVCRLLINDMTDQPVKEEYIACIFDIGGHSSNMTVMNQNQTIYSREESFGGELLLSEMMREYNYTMSEALTRLQNNDVDANFEDKILNPHKDALVLHIRRSLQFFFSASHYHVVHYIILAGGSANIPGVRELLEDQLGIKTCVANPFQSMTVNRSVDSAKLMQQAPALLLCCGLALRNVD
jgi:type IV pilus assembly protein PilM